MRRPHHRPARLVLIALLALTTMALSSAPLQAQESAPAINWDAPDVISGRLLVTFTPDQGTAMRADVRQGQTAALDGLPDLSLVPIDAHAPAPAGAAAQAAAPANPLLPNTFIGTFDPVRRDLIVKTLVARSDVAYVEPDRVRVRGESWGVSQLNDPKRADLWGMDRIGAPAVWPLLSTSRSAVRVAVMEGPFDASHRDLAAQVSPAQNNSGALSDHATHVAGTIAATGNNGQDVVGVANVELVALSGGGSSSGFAQQIAWAQANGVRVINMSWKWCGNNGINDGDDCLKCIYPDWSITEQLAISAAAGQIAFVGAADNQGCNRDPQGRAPTPVSYPFVIGVSAADSSDARAAFSNYGAYVDLAGPGVGILSTVVGDQIAWYDGTSMASPHVAGAIAAVLSRQPGYNTIAVQRLLELTADDLGAQGRDDEFGAGMLRVDRAVSGIAERYAEAGGNCSRDNSGLTGTVLYPHCDLPLALALVASGGTVGIVRDSAYAGAHTISKPVTLVAVGGPITLGR